MATLLQIDSSPMGSDAISRRLTREFRERWLHADSRRQAIVRDLALTRIPPVDAAWIAANYTPERLRTQEQREILRQSSEFIAELQSADELVLGAPMHNWGPPSCLKLWIDCVVTPATKLAQILRQKRALFIIACGGTYPPEAKSASRDHLGPWLRTVFGGLGLERMRFIMVDGTKCLNEDKRHRERFLAPYLASVEALAC